MPNQATKDRYRAAQREGNCFYNTLGSYCFHTQSIEFTSFSGDDFDELAKLGLARRASGEKTFSAELYSKMQQIAPISAHEYTHFLDCTATVWGIDLLLSLYRAYGLEDDERQYYIAKNAHEQIEGIRMPPYYSVIAKSVPSTPPWQYRITTGSIFDKNGSISPRQIPFLQFFNAEAAFLARSPISLLSMLEASSTFQELRMQASLIQRLPNDECVVENAEFSKKSVARLYDAQLTEYSVCTHLIANLHNISDAFVAYCYSATLTRFCLNLRAADISQFMIHDAVATRLDLDGAPQRQEIITRLNASLFACDRAVLFFVLARVCAIPNALPQRDELRTILSQACLLFDLDLTALEASSKDAFAQSHYRLTQLPNAPAALTASCLHNFQAQGDIFNASLGLSSLELPPAMYSDCTPRPAYIGRSELFKGFDLWQHFDAIDSRKEWVRGFAEACYVRPT